MILNSDWQAAIQSVREAAQSALRLTSISYNSRLSCYSLLSGCRCFEVRAHIQTLDW